ncbi:MAG: FG-GAP-like repeat-containing protein [Phycisphaerae bacterium]|nr:FG-GAP-like repeat-containing protein [Phycisphaerae bacterium]
MISSRAAALSCIALTTLAASGALAAPADDDLAGWFGFDGLEVVKIERGAGPFIVADINGDGLNDLVVASNAKSRIEIHYQKAGAKPTDDVPAPTRTNELPEHWRFRRETVSVGHAITALEPLDFDGDGVLDLVYSGIPGTIGFLRQTNPGVFVLDRKTTVKNLVPGRDAFAIADLVGDSAKEIAGLVAGRLTVWPLSGSVMGDAIEVGATGDQIIALILGDFDGNGRTDIAGIVPENPAPVRMWLSSSEEGTKGLGPQLRFEMPPLREATAIQLRGKDRRSTSLATIERPTKRIVVHDLKAAPVDWSGTREAPLVVWSFADSGNRKRSVATVDVDGDGYLDLLATNTLANAVSLYRQVPGKGLQPPVNAPAYADLTAVAAGDVNGDKRADIFLLSETESVVGRTAWSADGIPFPQAMTIAAGHVPVVQSLLALDEGTRLAVVAKDGRNYVLELLALDRSASDDTRAEPIKLGTLSKQPDAMLALDADQDGTTDILLFTADKPMTMLRKGEKQYTVLESKDMGQFGLVQAANDQNTAVLDVDGDGKAELIVADRNYLRALRYEETPAAGASPGWQVVKQMNADRADAKLVSLAVLPAGAGVPARLVAADRENSSLLLFGPDAPSDGQAASLAQSSGQWTQTDTLIVNGFKFSAIRAGAFSGDGQADIVVLGDDGFAIARIAGERLALTELASWRSDVQRRTHHELVVGDVNADGHVDIVALDAGEQMAEILTFSETLRMLYGIGFKVYETRIFSGGEPKEFEPSAGVIADLTGDGADDLILVCHDRILLYPQSTVPAATRHD